MGWGLELQGGVSLAQGKVSLAQGEVSLAQGEAGVWGKGGSTPHGGWGANGPFQISLGLNRHLRNHF